MKEHVEIIYEYRPMEERDEEPDFFHDKYPGNLVSAFFNPFRSFLEEKKLRTYLIYFNGLECLVGMSWDYDERENLPIYSEWKRETDGDIYAQLNIPTYETKITLINDYGANHNSKTIAILRGEPKLIKEFISYAGDGIKRDGFEEVKSASGMIIRS